MDTGGLLGPSYNYADELSTPSEIGVTRDGSAEGIIRAVAGVNYYVDAIGFGENTVMSAAEAKNNPAFRQRPLGISYFIDTGATCSNGEKMYEYISTIPSGLPGRVGSEIKKTLKVDFRGLAPGIMQDAVSALNPLPLFKAVTGSGYHECELVEKQVGDLKGQIRSPYDPKNVWIEGPVYIKDNLPTQKRWVSQKTISMEEYNKTPKNPGTEAAKDEDEKAKANAEEGFLDARNRHTSPLFAGILFAGLLLGILAWKSRS